MLEIDFTQHKEPFSFIKEAMKGRPDKEIQEAHENYCEFLNLLVHIGHDSDSVDQKNMPDKL